MSGQGAAFERYSNESKCRGGWRVVDRRLKRVLQPKVGRPGLYVCLSRGGVTREVISLIVSPEDKVKHQVTATNKAWLWP
jgi:hypothetical protein